MTRKQIQIKTSELRRARCSLEELEQQAIVKIRKHYAKLLTIKRMQLLEIQAKCKHLHTDYTADPSGGHDSCLDCVDCGKRLR